MNSLIKTTIKRPVTVCILVIVLMAVGVLATLDMSTNLLPNIKMPMLGISVVYPGASASSVESDVTAKIDSALKTIAGVTALETRSYDNASVAIVTFNYGTDIDAKISDIEDAFASVTFPDSCSEPSYIKIDMNGTATATISVYHEQGDTELLYSDANDLATRLRAIEGVGSVSVLGKPDRQIQFTALNGLELTALLAVQALSSENMNIPLGTIMQDGTKVSIRNATDATSVLHIMQLPVSIDLGTSTLSAFSAMQLAAKTFATCTLDDFNEYVEKARDAKRVIEEIEGKSADELEEQQQGLASVKALMTLLRGNSSQTLRLMWRTIDNSIVQNEEFTSMSDEDLQALANQTNISYDLLKWAQDGAVDGTLKEDWDKLVAFREIYPDDVTYDQFAYLFQDGYTGELDGEEVSFNGLSLLPTEDYSHEEAVDVCEFADSVNTIAYSDIINTVREAEYNGVTPEITDAQFAALFINTTQGNGFAALMSPQVIHIIRSDNFDTEGGVLDILTQSKTAHVNKAGNAVYLVDGKEIEVTKNDDGDYIVTIGEKEFTVNAFGRLEDADGNLVDNSGNVIELTDKQIADNYYTYGQYIIYSDTELVELYNNLNAALEDELDVGITPTLDTVHFVRICDFDADSLIVPLAYIGHVVETEVPDAYSQYNGMLSVTLEVYAVSDANTTDVVNGVKSVIANSDYASVVTLLDDKAEFINDSIVNVLTSIIIGGVLAVLVIYLFVKKIGSSLIVSITMPLSVLVALVGLWAMGISLNLVSLGGLAVGIGMLVDNSIVVLESITKRRDRGESVFDSCLNGTREVAGSLLASTLTNVCVFFPILFARGLTREIFNDLVWAVLFSIVMSLLVAITVIPSLYHLIYRKPRLNYENMEPRESVSKPKAKATKKANKDRDARKQSKKESRSSFRQRLGSVNISRLESGYGKILSKVLKSRVLVCVVALAVFLGSVGLLFTTGTEFMPSVDKGVIEVDLDFSPTTSLEDATAQSKYVANLLRERYGSSLQYVAVTVGEQGILATHNIGVLRIQTARGILNVSTAEAVADIRALLKSENLNVSNVTVREIDGVIAEVTGGMAGQSVELLSDDMELLRKAATAVAAKLTTADPEHIQSVVDNTPVKTLQYSFTFDRAECVNRGVDYQTAVLLLRVGLSGYTAASVTVDGVLQDVNVQFDGDSQELDAILNIVVGFDNDGAVKLQDVLTYYHGVPYKEEYVDSSIIRSNGRYSTTIDMEIYNIDSGTVGKTINKAVYEVLAEFDGVEYREAGVTSYLNDAFNGLVVSLVAAFVLLYSVMACQFESLTKPFIVIMSIPFAFTGGFLALVITGSTLNVVSFVGLIMLMGVIVNGAIVMIDKIGQLIEEGLTPQDAVIEGCKSRLRPILMTTLTTILALVPLALGLGRGGELMQPMGIVVLGGLLLGTLVTLVLIPCFYCIIKSISFVKPTPVTNDVENSGDDGEKSSDDGVSTVETTETN
ncbi:MAG: efflux RND transporter permease subunit [Clostridiales bacterium]|nr:efflux RND transporter permease subunit [Clostridiales bacterium]